MCVSPLCMHVRELAHVSPCVCEPHVYVSTHVLCISCFCGLRPFASVSGMRLCRGLGVRVGCLHCMYLGICSDPSCEEVSVLM